MAKIRTVCAYCGVGCGVIAHTGAGRIVGVEGDPQHPANFGRLCSKGASLHLTSQPDSRARHPELRRNRNAPRVRASWDEGLDFAAEEFARVVAAHGPDSVAFYVSGQLLTEDYYVFNKLARGLVGTNNIDTNSRLCMSSAVMGYKGTLGADAPPACYEDIDHAACIFIAGSNTAWAHPILFRRIEDARARNPQLKLVVVDPRRTETAAAADLHLAILPGSDVALFNAMLHVLIWEDGCDADYIRAHTEGFDALKSALTEYTPQAAARACGVAAQDIVQAARWFGAGPTLSLYCQGLNQSIQGTDKNAALINLHLASAQIGKLGAGPLSLTGQPNAMGGREVGGMATLLCGHRELSNPADREEIARLWGVPAIPATPGKTAVELFEAIHAGTIRAVWIACTNPVQSMPDQARVAEALRRAEFVVVQEAFRATETTPFADLLLPASAWGEKDGTLTNSERRISRVRAAVSPPGEARHDWEIAADFARRLGARLGPAHAGARFDYSGPEQIFNEHRETTRGRDLDITGLDYAVLETRGPQQWPFPQGAQQGRARLYEDGRFATPDGRARFVVTAQHAAAEQTSARRPLHLLSGRLRDQWHGMSRTGTVPRLFAHAEEPRLAMNPADLHARGLVNGDLVRVRSARGELRLRVRADEDMRPAQVYLPMHWGGRYLRGGGINALTGAAFDPVSKQPELKHAAVQVEKLELPWELVALRAGDALRYLDAVQPLLERFDYAACALYGHAAPVLVLRAATTAPAPALVAELDRALELNDDAAAMDYQDARRGVAKRVLIAGGKLVGARLCGETAAREWLKELMAADASADPVRGWMLAPVTRPPSGTRTRGRVLCTCMDVAEADIRERFAAGMSLEDVQAALGCGTGCGSCVPELRRMAGALNLKTEQALA